MKIRIAISVLVLAASMPAASFAVPPQLPRGPVKIYRPPTPAPKKTPCTHPGCPPQPHPTNNHRK